MMNKWTLNEEQVKLILNTKPVQIKESDVFSDIHLSQEERRKHASAILKKWIENQKSC